MHGVVDHRLVFVGLIVDRLNALSQCPRRHPSVGGSCSHRCRSGFQWHSANRRLISGRRAVAVDEESEAFAVGLTGPLAVPRLAARVVRIEPDAPQCLPATVRTPFHVAAVLVLLADTGTAVGTGFHRARICHLSPRPRFAN